MLLLVFIVVLCASLLTLDSLTEEKHCLAIMEIKLLSMINILVANRTQPCKGLGV